MENIQNNVTAGQDTGDQIVGFDRVRIISIQYGTLLYLIGD
jgi:hypothetical protein